MSYTSLSICKAPARAMIRQRRARAAPRLNLDSRRHRI